MLSVLSVGGAGVEWVVEPEDSTGDAVLVTGGGVSEEEGEVKCMVMRVERGAFVRETVMGMVGLWYLRRRS